MISRCANQDCGRLVAFFSEGRLFQFEVVSISVTADDGDKAAMDEVANRQTCHF